MVSTQYRVFGSSAKEISDSIETGIRTGGLQPNAPLPSVRVLAGQLEVAPGTVAAAYKLLRDRGLIQTNGRQGTFIRPPAAVRTQAGTVPITADVIDLSGGQPDPELLPRLGLLPPDRPGPAAAPPTFILPELHALARARLTADGIPTEALTLTSGGLDGIHRVLATQLRPGDTVAIEDPGWPNALELVAALGLRAYPLPLDADGPLPDGLRTALRAGARAIIVTNRAQNPTGTFLTRERASELRTVLADFPQTLVIEDDHAAELARIELASLCAATDSWAFIRSVSKPYGPDLRLALVTGDHATIARVDDRMRISSGWVSTLLQRLVLELWTSTEAASIVAKAAAAYDERRDQLISALANRGITATGRSGLNLWVPVSDETTVVAGLLQARWAVAPGARFRQYSGSGIRITISGLAIPRLPQLADDIASSITGTPQTAYRA